MGKLMTLAVCTLRQWALDWNGNCERIIESVRQARAAGCTLRVGPELEVTGYGCLDAFFESDTILHSWEMLARIIDHPDCQDIIVDCGMPVRHRNVRYNCRVIFLNRKILCIRPKQVLANDGNYREMRYFTPWMKPRTVEDYYLESVVGRITGQDIVPFGDMLLSTLDTCIGVESCEELWSANSPHIQSGLDGAEIFTNSSGSHFEIRKLQTRIDLIRTATQLSKGVYLYSNCCGCDGDRLYYDGCSMIIVNGKIVAQGNQFALSDVEVVCATVNIEEVRSARGITARGIQSQAQPPFPRINVNMRLSDPKHGLAPIDLGPSAEISPKVFSPAQEIALCPAIWLWDYLRRSGAAGFFIPLSGGIDSCATAMIVFSMCRLVYSTIHSDTDSATRENVLKDCRRICAEPDEWLPDSPQAICNKILHTAFLGTDNSSAETRGRAKELASAIGSYHLNVPIEKVTSAIQTVFSIATDFVPRFKVHGGSSTENLALQNIQARSRMIFSYLLGQLLPTVRKRPGGGGLLVLGSANVDEQLRGYYTKYDCSAADINPIGGISKTDLKSFIRYAEQSFNLPILAEFISATPTAELEPITENYTQSDEADMGVTYAELSIFGRLRKVEKLNMWGMYEHLVAAWGKPPPNTTKPSEDPSIGEKEVHETPEAAHVIHGRGLSAREVYEKVRHFFYYFNINRHKQTILPPSLHIESYSPDDNRFDLRQFLYPRTASSWPVQKIEEHIKMMEEREKAKENGEK